MNQNLSKKAYIKGLASQLFLRGADEQLVKEVVKKACITVDKMQKVASAKQSLIKAYIKSKKK